MKSFFAVRREEKTKKSLSSSLTYHHARSRKEWIELLIFNFSICSIMRICVCTFMVNEALLFTFFYLRTGDWNENFYGNVAGFKKKQIPWYMKLSLGKTPRKPQYLRKNSAEKANAVLKLNEIVCKFLGLPKLRNANRKLLCISFVVKTFSRSIDTTCITFMLTMNILVTWS